MREDDAVKVFIDCPDCGREVPDPFGRGNLDPHVHKSRGESACRFVVSIDPSGDKHRFTVLEPGDLFEDVMDEMWPEHIERVVRMACISAGHAYTGQAA